MLIECHSCPVRGRNCDGCLVTAMLTLGDLLPDETAPGEVDFGDVGFGDLGFGDGQRTETRRPIRAAPDPEELDGLERAALSRLVAVGLVSSVEAGAARARLHPQHRHVAAG